MVKFIIMREKYVMVCYHKDNKINIEESIKTNGHHIYMHEF